MKKSTNIQLSKMVKRPENKSVVKNSFAFGTVAAAVMLAGCSRTVVAEPENMTVFKTLNACLEAGEFTKEQCESAYQEAERNAAQYGPRYRSASECETDFGVGACTYRSSGGFGPLMAGFLIGRLSGGFNPYPVYDYRNRYSSDRGNYIYGDGTILGRTGGTTYRSNPAAVNHTVQTPNVSTKPKVTTSKTVSKGGFGSTSSAKSSWSSSSRSSWGG